MRAAALLGLLAAPLAAQEERAPQVDCAAGDLTQIELNYCAALAWEDADAELNQVYRLALTRAKVMDETMALNDVEGPMTTEDALRQAQRNWIAFRDSACAAEAMLAAGGTAQPMLGTLCLERLTRQRTEDLMIFGEIN